MSTLKRKKKINDVRKKRREIISNICKWHLRLIPKSLALQNPVFKHWAPSHKVFIPSRTEKHRLLLS